MGRRTKLQKAHLQAEKLAAKDSVSSTASVYKYLSNTPSFDVSINTILFQVMDNAFIEALSDIKAI